MECQNQHADDVLPEEGGCQEVFVEDLLFPDRTRQHDRVENRRLDDHRGRGELIAAPRRQVVQNQHRADEEDRELNRRQEALDHGPRRGIPAPAFFNRVERPARPRLGLSIWIFNPAVAGQGQATNRSIRKSKAENFAFPRRMAPELPPFGNANRNMPLLSLAAASMSYQAPGMLCIASLGPSYAQRRRLELPSEECQLPYTSNLVDTSRRFGAKYAQFF